VKFSARAKRRWPRSSVERRNDATNLIEIWRFLFYFKSNNGLLKIPKNHSILALLTFDTVFWLYIYIASKKKADGWDPIFKPSESKAAAGLKLSMPFSGI
jgi:hypothetical protein